MADRMVGACGLICTQCEAYQATQANDAQALQDVTEKWKVAYNAPNLTAEVVACDGCVSGSARVCYHCNECDIRRCTIEKGVANCGECADYASCERIQNFLNFVPQARLVLDDIHAAQSIS